MPTKLALLKTSKALSKLGSARTGVVVSFCLISSKLLFCVSLKTKASLHKLLVSGETIELKSPIKHKMTITCGHESFEVRENFEGLTNLGLFVLYEGQPAHHRHQ